MSSVRSRLFISESCPLILPFHVAVDKAREALRETSGAGKIGTTGKGIGPAYEDKVARRALRVQDLKHPERFAKKLRGTARTAQRRAHRLPARGAAGLRADLRTGDERVAEQLKPMLADVGYLIHTAQREGANILFEGAQGTLLDIDHGTYPYVTSSNCVAGNAAAGSGVGPEHAALHPGHHQGLHDARRLGAVPDRAGDGRAGHRRATTCRRSGRNAAR